MQPQHPQAYPITFAVPMVEGLDPAVIGQVAQLAAQAFTAAAAKQWGTVFTISIQIAGLIAQAFKDDQPARSVIGTPAPTSVLSTFPDNRA